MRARLVGLLSSTFFLFVPRPNQSRSEAFVLFGRKSRFIRGEVVLVKMYRFNSPSVPRNSSGLDCLVLHCEEALAHFSNYALQHDEEESVRRCP